MRLRPCSASSLLAMQTVLDSEGIKKLLPHRFPFLLVDRVIELLPREKIVGIKQVSINEPYFQGHFPGAPVMPGVLVIEALAHRYERSVGSERRAGSFVNANSSYGDR